MKAPWRPLPIVHPSALSVGPDRVPALRDRDEQAHEIRVERAAGAPPELLHRHLGSHRAAVGPVVRHRVPGIDDPHDPGLERDRVALKPIGIPGAVDVLVVPAGDATRGLEHPAVLEDLGTKSNGIDNRLFHSLFSLFISE